MDSVNKAIFRAIHEGKWLCISYRNKAESVKTYWIGIKDIDLRLKRLIVDGLRLSDNQLGELKIYISQILSASVIEGTYCEINQELTENIRQNPSLYHELFEHAPNLKILNYLADCYRMDTSPYIDELDYTLIKQLDIDSFTDARYVLSDAQFAELVTGFQRDNKKHNERKLKNLAFNVLSVQTAKGLYVLAYIRILLNVASKALSLGKNITICREFTVNGERQSVRAFLYEEDFGLLDQFTKNIEAIKDTIAKRARRKITVDDLPYLMAISSDRIVDLNIEYKAITEMYKNKKVTRPIAAFFGELVKRPPKRDYGKLAPAGGNLNMDQLLAIHNAMKYPLTYIQGPPGTGKTSTIINTLTTAFYNGRTVLFASYNNHPVDGVCEALRMLRYGNEPIPFPIIRLGSNERVDRAMDDIKKLIKRVRAIEPDPNMGDSDPSPDSGGSELILRLERYEALLDLRERKETLESLLSDASQLHFHAEIQVQLNSVNKRIDSYDEISTGGTAASGFNTEALLRSLYRSSVKHVRELEKPAFKEFLDIINMPDGNSESRQERVKAFNQYLSKSNHMKQFLRVFPIVATTCLSAHKLGPPETYFDMTVIDEASQCGSAVSLIPILRGKSLMLVGDPQQLLPVVTLNSEDNSILKKQYDVSAEYDYMTNSVYTTFMACDAVSDEILLSHHYRCHRKIIDFNNRKYYGGRLKVDSKAAGESPLLFINVPESAPPDLRNTAPDEVQAALAYLKNKKGKSVGVITPFANQGRILGSALRETGIDASCGTVHTFQGDEKDIILLSLALTGSTGKGAYEWLKNNKNLINVATSRAREQLVILCDEKNLNRLHDKNEQGEGDDLFELYEYVKTGGKHAVTERFNRSRALGVKPYSSETEQAFLTTLGQALSNIPPGADKRAVRKEVPISHVFEDNPSYKDLFYTGRFDFVVYEKTAAKKEYPVLAIELDGMEHSNSEAVKKRDQEKADICRAHGFELVRVENSYARRYHYIKDILMMYFKRK